jgi:hypothetical protein
MKDIVFDAQVRQFKRLLGVKQTTGKELSSIPVVTHPKSLKLPKDLMQGQLGRSVALLEEF